MLTALALTVGAMCADRASDGSGAARRRRERRLRTHWRHEQLTMRMLLASLEHHSAQKMPAATHNQVPLHSERQSGSILDIATALCSRSNSAMGFVNLHRVLSHMEGLCRTAKLALMWEPCESCVMVCARLPDFTRLKKTLGVFWSATTVSIAFGALQSMSRSFRIPLFPLAWHRRMHIINGYFQ